MLLGNIIGVLTLLAQCRGHAWVMKPQARGEQCDAKQGNGFQCLGPCEKQRKDARAPVTVQRGQKLNIAWRRSDAFPLPLLMD